MDLSIVNFACHLQSTVPKGNGITRFKIVLAKSLICTYNSRRRNTPVSHVSRQELTASIILHLTVLQTTRGKCRYCYTEGIENKTYIQCNTSGVFLCLISGNRSLNYFANFHTEV